MPRTLSRHPICFAVPKFAPWMPHPVPLELFECVSPPFHRRRSTLPPASQLSPRPRSFAVPHYPHSKSNSNSNADRCGRCLPAQSVRPLQERLAREEGEGPRRRDQQRPPRDDRCAACRPAVPSPRRSPPPPPLSVAAERGERADLTPLGTRVSQRSLHVSRTSTRRPLQRPSLSRHYRPASREPPPR